MPSTKRTGAKQLPSTGKKAWHGPQGMWPKTEDGKYVLTQSMVSSFVECPRETYYSIILGLRPRLESKPLTRGTWVHSLLEERANGGDWRAKHQEILEKARFDQFEEEVDELAEECYNILLSYEWVYRNENLTPIIAELTVERPMFNGKALYRGRIDLIVQDENGDVWLLDHKTHATLPDWRYRELAFQNFSYLWACQKAPQYLALGLPQPKGFIYDYCRTNAIKKPSLTQKGFQSKTLKPGGTTLPVYKEWLRENGMLTTVRGKDLLAIEDPKERAYVEEFLVEVEHRDYTDTFRRDFMKFTPEQSKRQLKSFLTSSRRMLTYKWDDPDCVERNLHACSGFMCNYKDLTVADLMHGTSEIEQKTRYVTTRDPLDYYPNQKKGKKKP
ncbi:exonuclease [Microbacterium phage Pikmin]|uniref:Exonuclease n=3 Tax=Pikminvirus pikmin TaxID=2560596 RepID=A0A2P1CKJ6_9CAUD|nr:exonuclease [Microbacterium phage Pikmin]AVJ51025.1 exonuclease [Microbacterium phage Pajaza]AVJ51172.1 exonuclease [Microbacterium phage Pikmin]AVJ51730.1 exonuclease [Microbacterium phage Casey]